jgi:hypothetical protein
MERGDGKEIEKENVYLIRGMGWRREEYKKKGRNKKLPILKKKKDQRHRR